MGLATKICIEYYRDYGETLVAIYCHDVHKDYEIETCETVNDLTSEKPAENAVLLTWSQPVNDSPVEGYRVFRNHKLLTENIITETSYLDENIPNGNYEYNVLVYYSSTCISTASNKVEETIKIGINEIEEKDIMLFPNPTTGELRITSCKFPITNIEICDVFGRKIFEQKAESRKQNVMDISYLNAGIYFVQITTEKGIITKKIVKQ